MSEAVIARSRRDPARRGRLHVTGARPARSRRCCSATAPAAASTPATWWRWPRALPAHGHHAWCCFEQPWRVAGRKVATPPRHPRRGLRRGRRPAARPHAAGRRRPLRRRPVRPPAAPSARGAPAAWRCRFPLHPPGRPEKSRLDELRGAGVPTLVVQGERDPLGRPEEFPADVDLDASSRAPTTASRCPTRGAGHPGRGDGDRRRGDAGVAGPRGRSGAEQSGISAGERVVTDVLALLERPPRSTAAT